MMSNDTMWACVVAPKEDTTLFTHRSLQKSILVAQLHMLLEGELLELFEFVQFGFCRCGAFCGSSRSRRMLIVILLYQRCSGGWFVSQLRACARGRETPAQNPSIDPLPPTNRNTAALGRFLGNYNLGSLTSPSPPLLPPI